MQSASAKKSSPATTSNAAKPPVAPSSSALKQSLRGKTLDEQDAALAPPAPGADRKSDPRLEGPGQAKGAQAPDKKVPGTRAAPHSMQAPGKGQWSLTVEGKSAHFMQRVQVEGAKADLPTDTHPAIREPVDVEAEGPWSVRVENKVPEKDKSDWLKPLPKGWQPSTHQMVSKCPDHMQVATEDFKDNDFNDLELSVVRKPEADEAYLVESETKVVGYQTVYDLIIGASSDGRLDVILDFVVIGMDELGSLDAETLTAMADNFTSFSGKLASSPEHADKKAPLLAEVSAWQTAIAQARAKTGAGTAKAADNEPKAVPPAPSKNSPKA